MGKIILEFDEFEDHISAQIAINANKLQSIIWEFDQKLRSIQKHECREETTLTEMRDLLRSILEDNGINFEHEIFT